MEPDERTKRLSAEGRVSGRGGRRRTESLWHVEVTEWAATDALRKFASLGHIAHAIAMDNMRLLCLFPDTRVSVAGELLDISYEKIPSELYYQMVVEDLAFQGEPLCVFFYPAHEATISPGLKKNFGTVYVIGLEWQRNADSDHLIRRLRDRTQKVIHRRSFES